MPSEFNDTKLYLHQLSKENLTEEKLIEILNYIFKNDYERKLESWRLT